MSVRAVDRWCEFSSTPRGPDSRPQHVAAGRISTTCTRSAWLQSIAFGWPGTSGGLHETSVTKRLSSSLDARLETRQFGVWMEAEVI